MNKLNREQILSLKKIVSHAQQMETKDSWTAQQVQILADEFKNIPSDDHEVLKKISKYSAQIVSSLSPKQLMNFIVPVERLLGQSSADHDFLVTTKDRPKNTAAKMPLEIYLDHWRSAFNVGSVFRTADALGIQKIHLGGYTATPEQDVVQKTALGSEVTVPWCHDEKPLLALQKLKQDGYRLIAFETSAHAKELTAPFEKQKSVFIFGNERFGLDPEVLSICDEIRKIHMQGTKNSMNASVCMAIATYEWRNQWMSN